METFAFWIDDSLKMSLHRKFKIVDFLRTTVQLFLYSRWPLRVYLVTQKLNFEKKIIVFGMIKLAIWII